jgi:hypothetical protein
MKDPVNAPNRLFKALGIPQVSCDEISIQMANFAVVSSLAYHQSGAVTTQRKLVGYLLANKSGSSGDQQI